MYEREIELKIRELSENLKKEVLDYVEFLLEKYKRKKERKLKFSWENALSDVAKEFTSVELQHKSLGWR